MKRVAAATSKLTILVKDDIDRINESPGGGGEEFIDHSALDWGLVRDALVILKECGFKSFREYSEYLSSVTSESYVSRFIGLGILARLPMRTSFSRLPFEITVSADSFDTLEAAFREQLYVHSKPAFRDVSAFFIKNGATVTYEDLFEAECFLNSSLDGCYTKHRIDPEKLWVLITDFIKVVYL